MKIISGGQTGVDQAALRAALECRLDCGGWCPPGRACESGVIPAEFPLRETPDECSAEAPGIPRSQRTEWNVRDSDATLILLPRGRSAMDSGTEWSRRCAERYGRPILISDPMDANACAQIRAWLRKIQPGSLNVSGPSERTVPGIGQQACVLLVAVFTELS
jgi:hypothetical protein